VPSGSRTPGQGKRSGVVPPASTAPAALSTGVREVTSKEVDRFFADGWVSLPGLLSADLAAGLLCRAQAFMGSDGDENALRPGFDFETSASSQPFRRPSDTDSLFGQVSRLPQFGRNAALLLGRDFAQRFFDDSLLVKLPVSRRPDRGQPLGWHADTNPSDRTWVFFWMALDRIEPAQGGVRYLSGSHKLGQLWRGGACIPLDQAYEIAPRLRSCPMSEPVDCQAGDAIAHCSGVVHGTDANTGTSPRWVYRTTYFPADAIYLGIPSKMISERGIQPFDVLSDPGFPIVYQPAAAEPGKASALQVRRFHDE